MTANSAKAIALERGASRVSDGITIAETFHTRYTGG